MHDLSLCKRIVLDGMLLGTLGCRFGKMIFLESFLTHTNRHVTWPSLELDVDEGVAVYSEPAADA